MNSLRTRLLAWLLGAVAVIAGLGGWFSYRHALTEANAFFDYHLQQTAMLLREQAYGFAPRTGLPQEVPAYDFVVQVWTLDGLRIYQSRPHTVLPGLTQLGLSTVETSNGRWRVFGIQATGHVIQVAQPMNVRESRAAQFALRSLQPFALVLPVLALLIVWIVRHSLRPVGEFSNAVRARRPDALEPLADTGLPDEIRPVVTSLNDLLARLRVSIEHERAFIADAAHELRTPLTALDLQVQQLATVATDDERAIATRELRAGVDRATRLVEQLLALAREERVERKPTAPVELGHLVRDVLQELLPLADRRGVDVGVEGDPVATVRGEQESLRVLVRNLVDNAIRYTPREGRVDIELAKVAVGTLTGQSEQVRLTVTDTGPGIPVEERERVFDRFYRLPGAPASGSGIGLALVQAIAARHRAQVRLLDGPGRPGLRVEVTLPAS
jgi:two-component system OmpR family sensor kinase